MRIFACIGDLHMHIIYFRTYNNDKNNRGDIMKSYIYSLLIMSFIAGIINSYAENLNKTQKYINYFMSIIMIILMISPLTSIISNTEKIKENMNFIIEEITDNESIQGTNEITLVTPDGNFSTSLMPISEYLNCGVLNQTELNDVQLACFLFYDMTFFGYSDEEIEIAKKKM